MTTIEPFKSVSLCQRYSASWPKTSFAAWNASSSQLLPGNTTTPNRISAPRPAEPTSLTVPTCPTRLIHVAYQTLIDFDAVALDHGIGEHLVRNLRRELPRRAGFGGFEIELEVFALAHGADVRVAKRVQRLGNRPPLWIEYRRLERHEHTCAH